MAVNVNELNNRLWAAADQLRANSKLKSSEYAVPVLGLIFLRYADQRFQQVHAELTTKAQETGSRHGVGKADYHARGVLYLPEQARFSHLLNLPEGDDLGRAINEAMKAVEAENEELKGVLPATYQRLENDTLAALLRTFSGIPMDVEGDVFGRIYEYFLGKFAMAEGQRGGEFFTPTSLVRLMVEVIEPQEAGDVRIPRRSGEAVSSSPGRRGSSGRTGTHRAPVRPFCVWEVVPFSPVPSRALAGRV